MNLPNEKIEQQFEDDLNDLLLEFMRQARDYSEKTQSSMQAVIDFVKTKVISVEQERDRYKEALLLVQPFIEDLQRENHSEIGAGLQYDNNLGAAYEKMQSAINEKK